MKLFVDVDNTVFDSKNTVCKILNKKYGKCVKGSEIKRYDFKDMFPELVKNEIRSIFNRHDFYEMSKVIPGAISTLSDFEIQKNYTINYVTLGSRTNSVYKHDALEKIKELFGVDYCDMYWSDNSNKDKSFVDMTGGIMIDDDIDCLRNCNATVKILIKLDGDTEWNKINPCDDVYVVTSWKDVQDVLKFYIEQGKVI